MIYVNTEELWQKAFDHQDKLVRAADPKWIPVTSSRRPKKDEWVQLLINDRLDGQGFATHEMLVRIGYGVSRDPLRVIVAMYMCDDHYCGFPCWYRGYVGSSPITIGNGDTISHWQPLVAAPIIPEMPDEL